MLPHHDDAAVHRQCTPDRRPRQGGRFLHVAVAVAVAVVVAVAAPVAGVRHSPDRIASSSLHRAYRLATRAWAAVNAS